MAVTKTLIAQGGFSIPGGGTGSISLNTTADVQAGDKILLLFTGLTTGGGSFGAISDGASNVWDSGTPAAVVETAVFTPSGTAISIAYNLTGVTGASVEVFVYRLTGLTGNRTNFGSAGTGLGAFTYNLDAPASGDFYYVLLAGDTVVQGSSGADIDTAYVSGGWTSDDSAKNEAPFAAFPFSNYYTARLHSFSKSWSGDGTLVTFGGNNTHSVSSPSAEAWGCRALKWSVASTTGARISTAFSRTGRKLRAYTDSAGALKVDRFDDNWPQAVIQTLTLETSGCTGVSLSWVAGRSGWAELAYAKNGVALLRRSKDGGRTWSVAETIASGYQDVASLVLPKRGLRLVFLWKESETRWYAVVGRLNDAGTAYTYPTAPAAVTLGKSGAALSLLGSVVEFDYRSNSDVMSTLRGRKFSVASIGSWG